MSGRFLILALSLGCSALLVFLLVHYLGKDSAERPEIAPVAERTRSQLEVRDDRLYLEESPDQLFTGRLVEFFPDGPKRVEIEIVDGRPHGQSRGWHDNGQLEVEEHFTEGVSHGLRTRWHRNGKQRSQAQVAQGVITGRFVEWHDNGVKAVEMGMANGKPDGECRAWFRSGAPKSVALMDEGTVVERQFFEDDEPAAPALPVTTATSP